MRIKQEISIEEVVQWTGATIIGPGSHRNIESISTDSRTLEKGDFFIPLKGDNFDGHDYVEAALRCGASGFVYEKDRRDKMAAVLKGLYEIKDGPAVFEAADSRVFLMDLAAGYLRRFKVVTIGITGSLGKTTVKNLISSVMSRAYNIVSAPGNYNTDIGVSKTILEVSRDTDYLLVELGMRGAGQIGPLAEASNVKIGAITSVSGSHMEFFDSLEELAAAKAEIGVAVERNRGKLFLNADDAMTPFIKTVTGADIIEFGRNKETDYCFTDKGIDRLGRYSFVFCRKNKRIVRIRCRQPGYHNLYNNCLAAAVCHYNGAGPDMIKEGLENAEMEGHRMRTLQNRGIMVLDDCYNASPVSMKAALDTLSVMSGNNKRRSVAILGDMLELGSCSEQLHYQTGNYSAKKDIDVLIASGKLAKNIYRGFLEVTGSRKRCFYFNEKKALLKKLHNIIMPGDIILVKGSRANKMEDIVVFLTE